MTEKPTVEYTTTEALIFDRERLRAEVERRQKALDDCVASLADERVENERLQFEVTDWQERNERLSVEAGRLSVEVDGLRAALRQILEDPEARILDSHRDDGWEALGRAKE